MMKLQDNLKKIAHNSAEFLWSQQVVSSEIIFDLAKEDNAVKSITLLRNSESCINLQAKIDGKSIQLSTKINSIQLHENEFFRVGLHGKLSAVTEFYGLIPQHKGIKKRAPQGNTESQQQNPLRNNIISILTKIPGLIKGLRITRDKLFSESPNDFTLLKGVTFRLKKLDVKSSNVVIEAYDEGGIYDFYINAEGLDYPAQVAGNYYADAYSALLFSLLFQENNNEKWKLASEASLRFLKRIYPQYRPANIAWHHSDFKNAALLTLYKITQNDNIKIEWGDFQSLVEDHYEPTNVYALRYHWHSLLGVFNNDQKHFDRAQVCLARLEQDQTDNGLFHDNVDVYPDAHDLTYHQYSTVCIALGLEAQEDKKARKLFSDAVSFSLKAVTPTGEPAYVGRAANNIHHSASTVLAFVLAAKHETDPIKKGQYIRASRLITDYLYSFQASNGMLPTAMNTFVKERMAWNHCETPYNAFVGAMLMLAHKELKTMGSIEEQAIPQELDRITVANDSGFAFLSNKYLNLVIFGGCAQSYGWSEGRHYTGVGGIAHLSYRTMVGASITPVLSVASPSNVALTELPVLNGIAAFGRATLTPLSNGTGVSYQHVYGDAQLTRLYIVRGEAIIILSKVQPLEGKTIAIEGICAWPLRDSDNWHHGKSTDNQYLIKTPQGEKLYLTSSLSDSEKTYKPRLAKSKQVSNAKGHVRRVCLYQTINSSKAVYSQMILTPDKGLTIDQVLPSLNLTALFNETANFI